jgi:hypothetical protein
MPADINPPTEPIILDERVLAALAASKGGSDQQAAASGTVVEDHDCADCD